MAEGNPKATVFLLIFVIRLKFYHLLKVFLNSRGEGDQDADRFAIVILK